MRSKLEILEVKCKKLSMKYHKELIKQYMANDTITVKESLNRLYGSSCYADTDSVIYKDFNKKQEI